MRDDAARADTPSAAGAAWPAALGRCAGLALLAAGQLTGLLAAVFVLWTWHAGGDSYQSGRVGDVAERLFPLLLLLSAAGTALAARRAARRDGQPPLPWMAAGVLLAAAVGAANHAAGWRLLGAPVHALRPLLGPGAIAAAAAVELALGAWLLHAARRADATESVGGT